MPRKAVRTTLAIYDGNRGRTGFRLASTGSKISGSFASSRLELTKTALGRGAKRPHPEGVSYRVCMTTRTKSQRVCDLLHLRCWAFLSHLRR
jgi:hypothetical protein